MDQPRIHPRPKRLEHPSYYIHKIKKLLGFKSLYFHFASEDEEGAGGKTRLTIPEVLYDIYASLKASNQQRKR